MTKAEKQRLFELAQRTMTEMGGRGTVQDVAAHLRAAYPDVLVTRAVTDGQALDLVLRPGNGGGRTTLGIERLQPQRDYEVTGGVEDRATRRSEVAPR